MGQKALTKLRKLIDQTPPTQQREVGAPGLLEIIYGTWWLESASWHPAVGEPTLLEDLPAGHRRNILAWVQKPAQIAIIRDWAEAHLGAAVADKISDAELLEATPLVRRLREIGE